MPRSRPAPGTYTSTSTRPTRAQTPTSGAGTFGEDVAAMRASKAGPSTKRRVLMKADVHVKTKSGKGMVAGEETADGGHDSDGDDEHGHAGDDEAEQTEVDEAEQTEGGEKQQTGDDEDTAERHGPVLHSEDDGDEWEVERVCKERGKKVFVKWKSTCMEWKDSDGALKGDEERLWAQGVQYRVKKWPNTWEPTRAIPFEFIDAFRKQKAGDRK